MNDWKNETTEAAQKPILIYVMWEKLVVTDEYKGKSKSISCHMENAKHIWCTQLSPAKHFTFAVLETGCKKKCSPNGILNIFLL